MINCKPIPTGVGDQYRMVRNDLLDILADANDWDTVMAVWRALENLKGVHDELICVKPCDQATPQYSEKGAF